jgi:Family of unknown function (DUF6338)
MQFCLLAQLKLARSFIGDVRHYEREAQLPAIIGKTVARVEYGFRKQIDGVHQSVSMFYFALFFWLLILINRADVRSNLVLYNVLIFLTSFVIPALLGYIGSILTKASWLRKLVRTQRHPTPTGWDYVFQQPKSYWILFHLTSGKLIGGYYDHTGFVSSYPQPQEIYVSQFWRVSDDGKFLEKVDRTAGGIIKAEEWTFIELFEA